MKDTDAFRALRNASERMQESIAECVASGVDAGAINALINGYADESTPISHFDSIDEQSIEKKEERGETKMIEQDVLVEKDYQSGNLSISVRESLVGVGLRYVNLPEYLETLIKGPLVKLVEELEKDEAEGQSFETFEVQLRLFSNRNNQVRGTISHSDTYHVGPDE